MRPYIKKTKQNSINDNSKTKQQQKIPKQTLVTNYQGAHACYLDLNQTFPNYTGTPSFLSLKKELSNGFLKNNSNATKLLI
jgi:hypothetical protein